MSKKLTPKRLAPIHPGEHLADILKEAGLSANALALQIRVPANRITEMIKGKRNITADTALRLARFFGTSNEFWMNLQSKYDIDVAQDSIAERIKLDVTPMKRAG
jgi:antitoxin HigA-1